MKNFLRMLDIQKSILIIIILALVAALLATVNRNANESEKVPEPVITQRIPEPEPVEETVPSTTRFGQTVSLPFADVTVFEPDYARYEALNPQGVDVNGVDRAPQGTRGAVVKVRITNTTNYVIDTTSADLHLLNNGVELDDIPIGSWPAHPGLTNDSGVLAPGQSFEWDYVFAIPNGIEQIDFFFDIDGDGMYEF
jgi:hypothetical protein